MELSYEDAQKMIDARLNEHPPLKAVARSGEFQEKLAQALDFEGVSKEFFQVIENEVLLVLSLYAPLSELVQNIQEVTQLSPEKAQSIATLIETLILDPVHDDLQAYSYFWQEQAQKEVDVPDDAKNVKEKLELRPEGQVKPLTREEVLAALSPRRTMGTDIESLRRQEESEGGEK